MTQAQREAITWTNGLLVFQTDAPIGYYYLDQYNESWKKIASTADIQWTTSGSDIYYNTGNVGIGTTTPPSLLSVAGGAFTTKSGLSNASNRPAVGTSRIAGEIAGVGPALVSDDGFLRLSAGGGTSSTVKSFIDLTGYSTVTDMLNNITFGTAGTERMRINNLGYVGIGVTNPIYPLQVDSYKEIENQAGYYFSGTTPTITANFGNWNVGIYSVNSILTSGAFVAFSDLRIKENIKEIPHSLDLVRKLRPVSYNKIDKIENGGRTEFGFIAQEVEEILPEAVNTGTGEIPILKPFDKVAFEAGVSYTILVKNGDDIVEQKYTIKDPKPKGEIIVKSKTVNDFKSLSYDMIFTVAVEAIREQQTQIESQQGQLASQQAQIEALKAQNVALAQKTEAIDQLKAEVERIRKMMIGQSYVVVGEE
jgi:hypothetical protein